MVEHSLGRRFVRRNPRGIGFENLEGRGRAAAIQALGSEVGIQRGGRRPAPDLDLPGARVHLRSGRRPRQTCLAPTGDLPRLRRAELQPRLVAPGAVTTLQMLSGSGMF